jgi:hypothetical protein
MTNSLTEQQIKKFRKRAHKYVSGKGRLNPKWLDLSDLDSNFLDCEIVSLTEEQKVELYPFVEDTSVEIKFRILAIDCGRTLEYAQKFINSEAQIALFRNSSIHRRCFDIIWNNKTGTNSKLDPPMDLQDFKSSGSGLQHTIVLIMLMINAFATAHMTGKKVYLRNHPESHLHPAIQANLADLLVKFAVTGFSTKQSEFPF